MILSNKEFPIKKKWKKVTKNMTIITAFTGSTRSVLGLLRIDYGFQFSVIMQFLSAWNE